MHWAQLIRSVLGFVPLLLLMAWVYILVRLRKRRLSAASHSEEPPLAQVSHVRISRSARIIVPTVVAMLLLLIAWPFAHIASVWMRAAPAIGKAAPALRFHLLSDGSVHTLAEYRGKVVLVNVWATWCPPCRLEMPDLDALQRDYSSRNLVVLAISDEQPSVVRNYRDLQSMQLAAGYVDSPQSSFYFRRGGVRPISYVIDPNGILRSMILGQHPAWYFRREVSQWTRPGTQ